tara:strand:- start:16027 stop:16941 length:915 start_codon:yes stop_codon:yes gene_type:complete
MPIPDFQATMQPLLVAVKDGEIHKFNSVIEQLKDYFNLSDVERQEKIASGKQTIIKNRISWARTYLTKAGLLESPGRGLTKITPRGLAAIAQTEQPVRVKYLKKFPEFKEFHTAKPKSDSDISNSNEIDDSSTPEDQLETAHQTLFKALTEDILNTIKGCTPEFFEQLVVDLMISMGYGGSRKEAGEATQYTADGGIDGVIKEDPLGLDTIYLQAKRYTDGVIGRPEIQKFAGALDMKRAKKGVFITTSRYSNDAHEYVGMIEKRIVLIDGNELASLMIQHGLGVTIKQTYEIKQIDTDYFNED